jgi:hypothetical protein
VADGLGAGRGGGLHGDGLGSRGRRCGRSAR